MKILVVGRELDLLHMAEATFRSEYPEASVAIFTDVLSAKEYACTSPPDVAFINIDQENGRGKAFAQKLVELNEKTNLIFVSQNAYCSAEVANMYPSGYYILPISRQNITEALRNLRYPMDKTALASG